ncbi:MAG: tRNA lysidine(34) synthetase TilS [Clostridia bacterium]|nr:tRNA lysidine(34) synthetase TilS [Clostridia bacterium]
MEKKIIKTIQQYGMEDIFDGAVIGFSGGADSSALLHFLKDRCKKLLAVHINHMIRGEEAMRDMEHCQRFCEKHGISLYTESVDIPTLSRERKKGLEETAREERYRIFNELLSSNDEYKCILTAHNSNDNAETIIFNLCRGTGMKGICGISPVNGKIYRPLISVSREEILAYCEKYSVEYVTDSTNLSDEYTRNDIRHNILPRLEKINPSVLDACTRLGEILRHDEEYISRRVFDLIKEHNIVDRVPTKLLLSLEYSVASRLLRHICTKKLDYSSVNDCLELAGNGTAGQRIDIAGGISFKLERDYVAFIPTEELEEAEFCQELFTGVNMIENTSLAVAVGCDFSSNDYVQTGEVSLNSKEIFGTLYVRSKKNGDTIRNGGMTKKLKRVLSDRHIPSHIRTRLPVICDEMGVLTIPSIIARDGAYSKKGDLIIKTYIRKRRS